MSAASLKYSTTETVEVSYKSEPLTSDEWRFWSKVLLGNECWEWTGAVKKPSREREGSTWGGQELPSGKFRWAGRMRAVHRCSVVFALCEGRELTREDVDRALESLPPVLHSCDNPKCARPRHLTPGTLSDNLRDAWARGRRRRKLRKKLRT